MSGLIPLPDDYYHYAIKTRSSNNQQSNQTKEETQEDEKTVLANEENKREEKIKKYIGEEKKWVMEYICKKFSLVYSLINKHFNTKRQKNLLNKKEAIHSTSLWKSFLLKIK